MQTRGRAKVKSCRRRRASGIPPGTRRGAYPSAAAEFFRPPGRFRYAGAVLLAILLLLADALPAPSRLARSVLAGIAGSGPGPTVAIDADPTRAPPPSTP